MKTKSEETKRYEISHNMECEVEVVNKFERRVTVKDKELYKIEELISQQIENFYTRNSNLKIFEPDTKEFKTLAKIIFDLKDPDPDDYSGLYVRMREDVSGNVEIEFELDFDPDIPTYRDFSSYKTIIELTTNQERYLKLIYV